MREANLPDRAPVGGVELENVSILDDRLPVLLSGGVLVALLQIVGLLGLWGTGTGGDEEEPADQEAHPRAGRVRRHVRLGPLVRQVLAQDRVQDLSVPDEPVGGFR